MKQKKTMKLWQMIAMVGLLTLIWISMFLPVFQVSASRVNQFSVDFMENLYSDAKSNGYMEDSRLDNLKESIEKCKEDGIISEETFDETMEKIEDAIGMDLTSLSAFDVMKLHVEVPYLLSMSSDISDSVNQINKALNGVKVPMVLLYWGALLIIAVLILGYLLKWSKYITAGITGGYALYGVIYMGIMQWAVPGMISSKITDQVSSYLPGISQSYFNNDLDSSEISNLMQKITTKYIKAFWNNILGIGFLLVFLFSILLLGMSAATIVLFRKISVMQTSDAAMSVPTFEPKLYCLYGEMKGAEIPLEDTPLMVGRDATACQLVFNDIRMDGVHFSIRFDSFQHTYILDCFSAKGLTIVHREFGTQQMSEGMSYQLKSGTEIRVGQEEYTAAAMFILA